MFFCNEIILAKTKPCPLRSFTHAPTQIHTSMKSHHNSKEASSRKGKNTDDIRTTISSHLQAHAADLIGWKDDVHVHGTKEYRWSRTGRAGGG
jgi:hypothetical protein